MAKLKCIEHSQRVMVLPSTRVIHREDGSTCIPPDTMLTGLTQNGRLLTPESVIREGKQPHGPHA